MIGDPFSRYVQLLLTLVRADRLTVVDDGTATMEFVAQLARGERLTRWHRRGRTGPRELVLAPVTATARRRFTPTANHTVEVFTAMPVEAPPGIAVTPNTFAWTRARFGPPSIGKGADLVGTSLVETGVVDPVPYQEAVTALARAHGATRYFAHRRESAGKLHALEAATGLEIVRPDLPLELIARRGPIGRTIVSFPSTVVHTLPLALADTGVNVAVCDIAPEWLRATASPRAQGFLSGVTETARGCRGCRRWRPEGRRLGRPALRESDDPRGNTRPIRGSHPIARPSPKPKLPSAATRPGHSVRVPSCVRPCRSATPSPSRSPTVSSTGRAAAVKPVPISTRFAGSPQAAGSGAPPVPLPPRTLWRSPVALSRSHRSARPSPSRSPGARTVKSSQSEPPTATGTSSRIRCTPW